MLKLDIRLISIYLMVLFLAACINNSKQESITTDLVQIPLTAYSNTDDVPMPKILFDKNSFDFGNMNQDQSVTAEFSIRNVGNAPLLIRSAKASCGCTVPDWPREPILAGDSTIIKVTFNSGKREGEQNKTVSLITNAVPSIKVLKITGIVLVSKNN